MRKLLIFLALISLLAAGCDLSNDRITKLEKQTQDLKAQADRDSAVRDYDLQSKCSTAAKTWFNANWQQEKNTILLVYTNHYNRSQNACFIQVEFHFNGAATFDWTNNVSVWNVLENTKLGEVYDRHQSVGQDFKEDVYQCSVNGTSCKSLDEFEKLEQN